MKIFYDQHDRMRAQLDAMRKLVTVLNFPESLAHEIRRDWPELRTLLRGLHDYFELDLPRHFANEEQSLFPRLTPWLTPDEQSLLKELAAEHRGLETLVRYFLELTSPWLASPRPPARSDVARLNSLVSELNLHLERHISIENERVLPLTATVLSAADRTKLLDEVLARSGPAERPLKEA